MATTTTSSPVISGVRGEDSKIPNLEDDVASIDGPLVSSANRKTSPTNGQDQSRIAPGDMLSRLSLNDDQRKDGLELLGADSLTTQPPTARLAEGKDPGDLGAALSSPPPDGILSSTGGEAHAHADAATEASQALQALQTAAAAANGQPQIPIEQRRSSGAQRKPTAPNTGDTGKSRGGGKGGEEDEEEEEELLEEEDDDEDEESSEISASDEDGSWISWFCSLRGNEFFCEVDEDYIQDDFNLTGLNGLVPYYEYALDMVLDVEMPMEDSLTEEQQEIVESAAEMLYGLVHARYIVTNRGMHAMYEKYRTASFGRCPHVFCQGQPVLPVGLSDLPRNYTVSVFCPRCHGLFFPKSTRQANIDGAYFGTTFPHLYLMTHPDMVPIKPSQQYMPRVYGFKIHQSSLYYRNHEEGPQHSQLEGERRSSRKSKHRSGRK